MPEGNSTPRTNTASSKLQRELECRLAQTWPVNRWQNNKMVVAVSGGLDSVALLKLLLAIDMNNRTDRADMMPSATDLDSANSCHPRIFAAHFDHRTRQGVSTHDAEFVKSLCGEMNIRCIVGQATTDNSTASEEALRAQRYQFLRRTAEDVGARYLVTAHHQDDQIETILFRILRGTGLTGLAGIKPSRLLRHGLTLVRPLLDISKSDLQQLMQVWRQDFIEDPTNEALTYHRNLLRNRWLPELNREFEQKTSSSLLRLASQAAELEDFLKQQCEPIVDAIISERNGVSEPELEPKRVSFQRALLSDKHPLVIKTCLRLMWRRLGYPEQAMGQNWWDQIATAIQSSQTVTLSLPGGLLWKSDAGSCSINQLSSQAGQAGQP